MDNNEHIKLEILKDLKYIKLHLNELNQYENLIKILLGIQSFEEYLDMKFNETLFYIKKNFKKLHQKNNVELIIKKRECDLYKKMQLKLLFDNRFLKGEIEEDIFKTNIEELNINNIIWDKDSISLKDLKIKK